MKTELFEITRVMFYVLKTKQDEGNIFRYFSLKLKNIHNFVVIVVAIHQYFYYF